MAAPNRKVRTAKDVFNAAVELYEPHQWEGFIVDACGDDKVKRERVRELLNAHRQKDSFFDEKGADADELATAERPGSQIGCYKLLQEIGEGGFGVVYMAEQLEPVRRKVALKIIKPGMDTKQVIARFEAERQALALMDHPNIAKVLDAGATESGRPYFVMELVKGVPVTEFCDKNNLSTAERLDLFVQICRAVQHAHQKGVIHRDLKPANVMVTLYDGHPVPMVIDFGVSKAISQQLTEKTLFTAYGQMIGTPQYMSPEQAEMSGLDVDTRSDVYSLGVLLYELLTGTTPLEKDRLNTLAYVEMQRVIQEEEPQRPSARLSTMGGELTVLAKQRSTDPKRLTQTLRGDLDWIVMKALSKERGRRYESASAFAADVERHLADETIEARPPSTSYQLKRVVRRHKGAAAAAAAILAVLLLGIAGTTIGLITATHSKNRALNESSKARLAEENARQAEQASREAEGQAHKNLERSEQLAGELATSLSKLSENTSRLATQRAYTLVGQNRSQEGLHWLARAAELTPTTNKTLEREIRTAMSVVADTLPQPRYVIAPEQERVFRQTAVSPDGERLALLVTGPVEAAELRLLDGLSGELIVKIDVPQFTREIGFSNDGQMLYAADGRQLSRWDAQTGAKLGLDKLAVGENEEDDRITDLLNRLPERTGRTRDQLAEFRNRLLSRRGSRVVAVGSDARLALLSGLVPPGTEASTGRAGVSSGRSSRFGVAGTIGLIDLKTQQVISRLPGGTPLHFDDLRQRVIVSASPRNRFNSAMSPSLRMWDVSAGQWDEDWQVDLDGPLLDSSISKDGKLALITTRASTGTGSGGRGTLGLGLTVRLVDVDKATLRNQQLSLEGPALDVALSPSGARAAILWTPKGERPRMMLWDLNTDETREVPMHLSGNVGLDNQPQISGFGRGGPVAGLRGGSGFGRGGAGGGNPNRYQTRIAADEQTLLVWNHDLLVAWRLPEVSQSLPDLPTAAAVRQFCYVGNKELLTVSSSGERGRLQGALAPIEIQRWSATRRQPIGDAIAVMANNVILSPDGRYMFLAEGNQVQRWDLTTMSKVADPMVCSGSIQQMELVADGQLLATYVTSQRGAGFLSQAPGGRPVRGERRGRPARITYQEIGVRTRDSRTGSGLGVASVEAGSDAEKAGMKIGDRIVQAGDVDVSDGERFRQLIDLKYEKGMRLTLLRGDQEHEVIVHPRPRDESEILLQIENNSSLQLWDVQTGNRIRALPVPREGTQGAFRGGANTDWATISPDGKRALTYCAFFPRAELRLFDTRSGRPMTVSRVYPRSIRWAGFGPQNKVIATLDVASSVQLWNAADLSAIGPRIRPTGTVTAITFIPDGSLMIGARTSNGAQLTLWDTQTSQRLSLPIALPVAASRLACSPAGDWAAVAASGGHFWLLPLPRPWTGEASRIRHMVEAMTGTSLAESGDIDELETQRWSRQLSTFAASKKGQFNDRPVVVSLRQARQPGQVGSGEEQLPALQAAVDEYPDRLFDRMELISELLYLAHYDEATEQMDVVLKTVDRGQVMSWLKRGLRARVPPVGLLESMRARNAEMGRSDESLSANVERVERLIAMRPWLIQQLRRIAPSDASMQLASLQQLLIDDRFSQAEAIYQEAMRGPGKDLMLENLVRLTRAQSGVRQFGSMSPADALAQYERGKWLLDRLLAERPRDWELLMLRAQAAAAAKQWDASLADIERAESLAPADQFEASLHAINPSRNRGQPQTVESLAHAAAAWHLILKADPTHIAALEAVSTNYARMADWERAEKYLQRLAAATPDDHYPQYKLAPVLLKLDCVDEYRDLCQSMLDQFHASSEPVSEGRAIQACLWHEGAIENAERLVTRMQTIFDKDTSRLEYRQTALGLAHFRNGEPAEAISWLEKALTADRLNANLEIRALAGLAMAHFENDDPDKASESLKRASERYAENGPSESGDWSLVWTDWLICELLIDEARSQIVSTED